MTDNQAKLEHHGRHEKIMHYVLGVPTHTTPANPLIIPITETGKIPTMNATGHRIAKHFAAAIDILQAQELYVRWQPDFRLGGKESVAKWNYHHYRGRPVPPCDWKSLQGIATEHGDLAAWLTQQCMDVIHSHSATWTALADRDDQND